MPVPMVMETRAMLLGSVPRYLYKAKKILINAINSLEKAIEKGPLLPDTGTNVVDFLADGLFGHSDLYVFVLQGLHKVILPENLQAHQHRQPAIQGPFTLIMKKIYKGWQKERPYRHDDISCLTRLDFQAVGFHWELLKNIQKKLHTNHLIIERSKIQQIHRHFPIAYVTIIMELSGCTR